MEPNARDYEYCRCASEQCEAGTEQRERRTVVSACASATQAAAVMCGRSIVMSAGIATLRRLLNGITLLSDRVTARGSGFHSGRMRDAGRGYPHAVRGGTVQDQRQQNQKPQRVGQNLHHVRRYWI
jgi:ribosomal protein L13E